MPIINSVVNDFSVAHKRSLRLMGNIFTITAVSADEQVADHCIAAAFNEIRRLENLLSTFKESSETNIINRNAGVRPVRVSAEVFQLIRRSIGISQLTQGAFDITYGSVDKRLWNFDTAMTSLPDPAVARQAVSLINYKNIKLNDAEHSVYLKEKGMRIGFGGIGKGYAAERAKAILQRMGIKSGIVNASGDLTAWGTQPGGRPWTIGIADPAHRTSPFSYLNVSGFAVATSGNYEKYVDIGGRRYSHTIDPRTGMPVHGVKSVTIICPNAELADAMATPVTIMGTAAGMHLVGQVPGMACIIIDDNNICHTSRNIKLVHS